MPDISNITRTYRFTNSVPFNQDYLENELSNIVGKLNTNFEVIKGYNGFTSASVANGVIGGGLLGSLFPSSGNLLSIPSATITEGDWDVSLHIGLDPNGATITSWSAGLSLTSTGVDYNEYSTGQLNVVPASTTAFTYIILPTVNYNISEGASSTVYVKFVPNYSGGDPFVFYTLKARRF